MSRKSVYIYSDKLLNYHFHSDHPFNQKRVLLTTELLKAAKMLKESQIVAPRMATDDELALFHDKSFIKAVQKASVGKISAVEEQRYGLGTEDTPIFKDMHEASSLLVGGTLTAVDAILEGDYTSAVNFAGGLHHGFKGKASGFCIYNDAAVAIKYIRETYDLKVLYVDTDAHHGDGVQWAFYDDPHVCTFSIHETGRYLFPSTGHTSERGIGKGHGYSFNLPLDAFTQDESFISMYTKALKEITEFFKPDIIITQNGADAHYYDPLTHLSVSMETFEQIPLIARELADQYCDGKWIALGGGGYDIWRVVPRAWAQVWNVMLTGYEQNGALPAAWLKEWQLESPVTLPLSWHDSKAQLPYIPRKAEIEEKNKRTLKQALKHIVKNGRVS